MSDKWVELLPAKYSNPKINYCVGWNDAIDGCLAALRGKVVLVKDMNNIKKKEIETMIDDVIPCTCIDAYKKRNLSSPDCANCLYRRDLVDAIYDLFVGRVSVG